MKRARFLGDGTEPVVAQSEDGVGWYTGDGVIDASAMRWAHAVDGAVIGIILNDHGSLRELAETFTQPPYMKPPQEPVLYIKPRNTLSAHGGSVELPRGATSLEIGATLGVVFAAATRNVSERSAFDGVQGYTVVMDLGLPQASLHRPPIREKCFDGSCPIGPWVTDRGDIGKPEDLEIVTSVNGTVVARRSLNDLVRPLAELISEISRFMTLRAGDVLLAGVPSRLPRAKAGDLVDVDIAGIGRLSVRLGGIAP